MLWLVTEDLSYQIISCNLHKNTENGEYEVWVTRPTGKNIKILSSSKLEDVKEIKEAIDYSIEHKEAALRLE